MGLAHVGSRSLVARCSADSHPWLGGARPAACRSRRCAACSGGSESESCTALGLLTDRRHAIRACAALSWQPQRRATLWAVCGTSLAVSAEAGLVPTRPEKVHLDRWQARLPIPIAPEGNRAMISPWHTRADATRRDTPCCRTRAGLGGPVEEVPVVRGQAQRCLDRPFLRGRAAACRAISSARPRLERTRAGADLRRR